MNKSCPICGLPIGEGSIGVPEVQGDLPLNIQIHVTVSLEPNGPPLWCLGHEGAEYISDVPAIPQIFYDAFE